MASPVLAVAATVTPSSLLDSWPRDPAALLVLLAGAAVYGLGARRLRASAAGRSALPRWRAAAGVGALVTAGLLLLTPLEPWAQTLFSVHMAQHLGLTLLLAPLLVLSRPVLVGAMALSRGSRGPLWRLRAWIEPRRGRSVTWMAAAAVLLHAATMWVWHIPGLYALALEDQVVHAVEHATLLGGAAPLWWLVLDARGRHATAASVLAVLATALQSAWLAGLLTFSGTAFITAHGAGPAAWGLTPLQDQQAAGGLMWFPGGLIYVAAGAWAFLHWLRRDEATAALVTE